MLLMLCIFSAVSVVSRFLMLCSFAILSAFSDTLILCALLCAVSDALMCTIVRCCGALFYNSVCSFQIS